MTKFSKTDPSNPFRNSQNQLYAKALFWETNEYDKSVALYTLKNHDHQGLPSLYQLYMSKTDLDEYTFARTYFEGWRHWEQLISQEWFKPYVETWRDEFALKKQSEAINRIRAIAEQGGKDALAANRYIAERGWERPAGQRGRPLKVADPAKVAKKLALEDADLEADFARVMGNG